MAKGYVPVLSEPEKHENFQEQCVVYIEKCNTALHGQSYSYWQTDTTHKLIKENMVAAQSFNFSFQTIKMAAGS